jgi:hypothetical protein
MTSAATYVATAGHADHATVQFVDPGEVSYPYTLGFVLPSEARDDVGCHSQREHHISASINPSINRFKGRS